MQVLRQKGPGDRKVKGPLFFILIQSCVLCSQDNQNKLSLSFYTKKTQTAYLEKVFS